LKVVDKLISTIFPKIKTGANVNIEVKNQLKLIFNYKVQSTYQVFKHKTTTLTIKLVKKELELAIDNL